LFYYYKFYSILYSFFSWREEERNNGNKEMKRRGEKSFGNLAMVARGKIAGGRKLD